VRMVAVSIGISGVRAPLLVTVIRAQVGNHDCNGSVLNSAGSGVDAVAGRGDLEASAATGAAPRAAAGVKDGLARGGCVLGPLPAEGACVGCTAPTSALLSVPITGGGGARQAIEHRRISCASRISGSEKE